MLCCSHHPLGFAWDQNSNHWVNAQLNRHGSPGLGTAYPPHVYLTQRDMNDCCAGSRHFHAAVLLLHVLLKPVCASCRHQTVQLWSAQLHCHSLWGHSWIHLTAELRCHDCSACAGWHTDSLLFVLVLCLLRHAVAAVFCMCRVVKQWHTAAVAQRGINQEQATKLFCGGEHCMRLKSSFL
jgi:hypothetical protein